MKSIDISNKVFGKLTAIEVVGFVPRQGNGKEELWKCKCECGNDFTTKKYLLLYGKIKSCGCWTRMPAGEAAFNQTYSVYKHSAKKHGRKFEISKDEFSKITSQNCYYCGAPPSNKKSASPRRQMNGEYVYNGIDRVDSRKGYTTDNIVSCCIKCNTAKNDMTYKDFKEWICMVSSKMHSWEFPG